MSTRLGKYEVRAEIGRGGMGAVYQGYHPTLDRFVEVEVPASLEGQTLAAFIQQCGPMSVEEMLRILRPLAEALDYAHGRGLVHRRRQAR